MSQTDTERLRVITAQWVLPLDGPPIEQGFVAFAENKIVAVGPLSELPVHWSAAQPQLGTILTPGLINAHVHLEQSFPQPIPKAVDEAFSAWLLRVVALIQQEGSLEAKLQRSIAGAREALSTGTTCVNDVASGLQSVEALAELGVRGVVSLEVFHPAVEPVAIAHWVTQYKALQEACAAYPLLNVGLSPHSPFNVSPEAWQTLLNECQPPLVHTHLAESVDETRYLLGQASTITDLHQQVLGRQFQPQALADSPVAYLAQFGLLNDFTVAAHAIHTSESDRRAIAQAGMAVAHCPRSNMALHGQTLSAADWQDINVPIALGTDGRLSTEDLDMRAEARYVMQLHGWTAETALQAMTVQGARALGLWEEIGSLTPGKAADMVLWQADGPIHANPYVACLHPQTQVAQVWIDGRRCWPLEEP